MSPFQSVFAERLAAYVHVRRQLGVQFVPQAGLLSAFDRYVHVRDYRGPLTDALARAFALAGPATSTTMPARRYLVVRHFSEYLSTYEPSTPRLDPRAFRLRPQPPPYIFTDGELTQLMTAARACRGRPPVANQAVATLVGLAASTGMRLGEVVNLDQADVDLHTGILLIRRSKFDKDRLVPVHATTLERLRTYAALREPLMHGVPECAFFISDRFRRYRPDSLSHAFGQLVQRIERHAPSGRRPTFHALRHTFAVHRLVAWHRAGLDVQACLPALATYMGHVHYTSTAYYLTATAELLGVAAERLAAREVPHAQA